LSAAPVRSVTIEKGQFLFRQGDDSDSFFLLKRGRLEILIHEEAGRRLTPEEIAGRARRIAVVDQPNSPIGEIGAIHGDARTVSVRALEPCELASVAGGAQAVTGWISSNLAAGLLIVRAMSNRQRELHARWHSLRLLTARLRTYIDNFTILYVVLNPQPPVSGSPYFAFDQHGRELVHRLPQGVPPNLTNVERNLPADDTPPPLTQPFVEVEECYFLKRLLEQPDESLGWLLAAGDAPHPLTHIATVFARSVTRLFGSVGTEMRTMEQTADSFFGPRGVIRAYIAMYGLLTAEQREPVRPYLHKMLAIAKELEEEILADWGETYPNLQAMADDIARLAGLMSEAGAESAEDLDREALADAGAVHAGVATPGFSLPEALRSIVLSPNDRALMEICLGTRPGREKEIQAAYWRLYPRLWQAIRENDIPEIRAFLRYGIASPAPVRLPEVFKLDVKPQGPVMYIDQWLNRIYRGESLPSFDELGQSIDTFLKNNKLIRYREDENDPLMDNVFFEIEQMLSRAARAFSGGRGESVTLRRTPAEIESLAVQLLTPGKLAHALVQLLQIDFSAFYRDVRVVIEERSEFLPRDVLPFIILVPAAGDRAISWQEFEGRAKDTPGRLVFPHLAEGLHFDLVIDCIARFRWNLAKSVAGINWMNPGEGGLSGKYYEYVTYYRKNPELTDDQKKKLGEIFSGATLDADRFAIEYASWIKFEAQGVQKLNRVARRIFTEHAPFALDIRKRLVKLPAYQETIRKDSNKRLKKRQELERRIYKLERNQEQFGSVFETSFKLYQEVPE